MANKKGGFLDMDKFTFCGRVIQAISEMIMEDTIQGPDINSIHTVFPDIVTNTEVGYIGEGGMVGVVNTGCNPTPQPWNINTRKLKWEGRSFCPSVTLTSNSRQLFTLSAPASTFRTSRTRTT